MHQKHLSPVWTAARLRLTGTSQLRTSSVVACSDTASWQREACASARSCGTRPTVDTDTCTHEGWVYVSVQTLAAPACASARSCGTRL